jgi:hypothetical protein
MMIIVWESKLDEMFDCKVVRTSDYTGRLTVVNTVTTDTILDKEVDLSYGALFGPDVSDVAHWQDMIIEAVDA